MAINHQQTLTIYQMVLDRVPFVIDDSSHVFTDIAILSVTANSITVSGNYTPYLRPETTTTFATPTGSGTVASLSYDEGLNETTIVYYALPPSVVAGSTTVTIEANYNEELISRYILQMMWVVQSCYRIDPESNVGDETFYNDLQKIVLAELVAYYIVFWATVGNANGGINAGGSSEVPTGTRYIKTAAADGISTTWEYLNIKNTAFLSMDAEKMMNQFKSNACSYGKQLGCEIQICDGGVSCSCTLPPRPIITTPFIVPPKRNPCRPYGRNKRC